MIRYQNIQKKNASRNIEVEYSYDPMGRRIRKTIANTDDQDQTIFFVYGDSGLMGEMNQFGELIRAYGFNPSAMQQGLWSTDPIWQAELAPAQGGIVSLESADAASYFYIQTDNLGVPIVASDENGEVKWRMLKDTFGVDYKIIDSGLKVNLRFPGQYYDEEVGFSYNFRRNYNNNTGRFMQQDPIGMRGGINFYEYGQSNPLMRYDSNGLLTSAQGYAHYCMATGTDLTIDFSEVNFGMAEGTFRGKVVEKVGSSCEERKIPFYWIRSFNASMDDFLLIGSLAVRIDGEISVNCDCSWSFMGSMKSELGYDLYDFNQANRGFIGESLTALGRNVCPNGIDYKIFLNGDKKLLRKVFLDLGKAHAVKRIKNRIIFLLIDFSSGMHYFIFI